MAHGSEISVFEAATWREKFRLRGHTGSVYSVAYSADGKTLASGSGSADKTVKLWDLATGNELQTLPGHTRAVVSVAYSPDGKTLISGSVDDSIMIHRVDNGVELFALVALTANEAYFGFNPGGYIDLLGADACTARQYPICRIGALSFPFDVCKERFLVPGLLAKIHAGDSSYLEPESAPALMQCPDAP